MNESKNARKNVSMMLTGMTSPEDVQAHRAEILQFAHDAALLHDVGKNSMLEIIETQHRPAALSQSQPGSRRSPPGSPSLWMVSRWKCKPTTLRDTTM